MVAPLTKIEPLRMGGRHIKIKVINPVSDLSNLKYLRDIYIDLS